MRSYGRERIVILAVWFASLIGIRLLLGSALSNVWIGTFGAVGITFGAFYLLLRYTPLKKYSKAVDLALRGWYRKNYVLYAIVASTVVMGSLMFFVEYGYHYHSDRILTLSELRNMNSLSQEQFTAVKSLLTEGYSGVDAVSIMIASVDKSLGGYYVRSISYLLAENMELIVFLFIIRRTSKENFFSRVVPPSPKPTSHKAGV